MRSSLAVRKHAPQEQTDCIQDDCDRQHEERDSKLFERTNTPAERTNKAISTQHSSVGSFVHSGTVIRNTPFRHAPGDCAHHGCKTDQEYRNEQRHKHREVQAAASERGSGRPKHKHWNGYCSGGAWLAALMESGLAAVLEDRTTARPTAPIAARAASASAMPAHPLDRVVGPISCDENPEFTY